MADRLILFSAPMVRALLDGRKTQTRRILKPAMLRFFDGAGKSWRPDDAQLAQALTDAEKVRNVADDIWTWSGKAYDYQAPALRTHWLAHLSFAKGDRLWVREAWRCNGWASDVATIFYRASENDGYTAMCEQWPVADHKPLRVEAKWAPSLHMPRWASRLTLAVSDVRVERLQDIREADCVAEGPPNVDFMTISGPARGLSGMMVKDPAQPHISMTPRTWYREVWDTINGAGSWDANPWVVALTFSVERGNIDQ